MCNNKNMFRFYFIVCVVSSLWTMLQTSLHLVFVIYAFFLGRCMETPSGSRTIFFYLTYLYRKSCKPPVLIKEHNDSNKPLLENYFSLLLNIVPFNSSVSDIVEELLSKIDVFPDEARAAHRATNYFLILIIADVVWLTTAVALLMGTCFRIKHRLAKYFYGPWLIVTALLSLFDVAVCVQFGFDAGETTNFGNWLKFVGVPEREFPDLDQKAPFLWTMFPSLAICSLGIRFILIWISNWVGFFCVLKALFFVYRQPPPSPPLQHRSLAIKKNKNRTHQNPASTSSIDQSHNFNTSAARIRNWQLFYGAIETTSTRSSTNSSSKSSLPKNNNNNYNNNNSSTQHDLIEDPSAAQNPVPVVAARRESLGIVAPYSGNYYAYSDVADSIEGQIYELRSHLPWSYTQRSQQRQDSLEGVNSSHSQGSSVINHGDNSGDFRSARRQTSSDSTFICGTQL